jgi:hypothetical protein
MEITDPLGFLLGSWRVERHIEDYRIGVAGTFKGLATFEPLECGGTLRLGTNVRYLETGELLFGAYRGHCQRSLEYVQREGTAAQILFANGRPFVDLDLSKGPSRSTHLCGFDHYEINFFAHSCDVLEEKWRVRGPMKDYEATTTLTRERRTTPPLVGAA